MPKALHIKLTKEARNKGLTGDKAKAYIYGTLAKLKKKNKYRVSSIKK